MVHGDDAMANSALQGILKEYWGYDSFRPLQQEAMAAVLSGRDSLVVLPTGGGKSICFQAPALAMEGMALVVSPLIALMKDQVDALRACGVPAACVHSMLTETERRSVWREVREGRIRLLYVAPERLVMPRFLEFLRETKLSFVAIDEAHCISMWGHDFRPEYRELRQLREALPGLALHAYTATATPQVREDIVAQLQLRAPEVLIGSFDRPNLIYRVAHRTHAAEQVRETAERHPGDSGIVYCITRKATEELAAALCAAGLPALPYHAGLDDRTRHANQEAFAEDRARIVVATVAFGMGIDKSNVRFVVHAGMPKSVEHYQQESGRAGRDGLEAECVLLHSGSDFMLWKGIIEKGEREGAEVALAKLGDMDRYCRTMQCRRASLLRYFGEPYAAENCGACDVCLDEAETSADAASIARAILGAVRATGQRFGMGYLSAFLRGEADERMRRNQHAQAPGFGGLKEYMPNTLRTWIDQLADQGFVERTGEYNVIELTASGHAALADAADRAPMLTAAAPRARAARAKPLQEGWAGGDKGLFDALRALRRDLAAARGVPPYVVFDDKTLRELARVRPSRAEHLTRVHGVGPRKAETFGEAVLAAVRHYCTEHGIAMDVGLDAETAPSRAVRRMRAEPDDAAPPSPRRPRAEAQAVANAMFRKGCSVEEVVEAVQRAQSTVYGYLADYLRDESVENPSPWVDAHTAAQIEAAAEQLGSERMRPIFEHFSGEVPYESLRVVLTCLRNRKGPGGIVPKAGAESAAPPAPRSPAPVQVPAAQVSPPEAAAAERFAQGEKPEAVAAALGKPAAWGYWALSRYIAARGIENPFAWIDKMAYMQVAAAAGKAESLDAEKVLHVLDGAVETGVVEVALACLRNRA